MWRRSGKLLPEATTKGQWFDCSPSSLEITVLLPNCFKSPKHCQLCADARCWHQETWRFVTSFVTWPVNSFFCCPLTQKVQNYRATVKKCVILIYIEHWVIIPFVWNVSDDVKHKLLHLHGGKSFNKLVTLASLSTNTEIQYNCAGTIGQITLIGKCVICEGPLVKILVSWKVCTVGSITTLGD